MRSQQMGNGIVVQIPPTTINEVPIDGGKKVKVVQMNGVYIEYSSGDHNIPKYAATGTGLNEDTAWKMVLNYIEKQLP